MILRPNRINQVLINMILQTKRFSIFHTVNLGIEKIKLNKCKLWLFDIPLLYLYNIYREYELQIGESNHRVHVIEKKHDVADIVERKQV
jgi:hypothetical protein